MLVRALVVYESMYGNTEEIARSVGEGLGTELQVDVLEVDSAPPTTEGYDLIVVGGPTHAHMMSSKSSRADTAKKAGEKVVSKGTGIRDWIGKIAPHRSRSPFATFDTRFDKPAWVTGSAARGAASRLRRRGFERLSPPVSFFIEGGEGPLREGEIDRAFEWGERLAVRLVMEGSQPR